MNIWRLYLVHENRVIGKIYYRGMKNLYSYLCHFVSNIKKVIENLISLRTKLVFVMYD